MKSTATKLLLLATALAPALAAQSQGLAPEWDVTKIFQDISAQANRLLPMLDQLEPQSWVKKGASETYVAQWNSARVQTKAIATTALNLSKQPEQLPAGLELFYRMLAVDAAVTSLGEGLRKYQNPALADLLANVISEGSTNRGRFQQYLLDLATQKEQEYKVMDQEAQRCRGMLSRQPPPPRKTERK